jgi:hypothetical protein
VLHLWKGAQHAEVAEGFVAQRLLDLSAGLHVVGIVTGRTQQRGTAYTAAELDVTAAEEALAAQTRMEVAQAVQLHALRRRVCRTPGTPAEGERTHTFGVVLWATQTFHSCSIGWGARE